MGRPAAALMLTAALLVVLPGPAWSLPRQALQNGSPGGGSDSPPPPVSPPPPASSCVQTLARVCSGAAGDSDECQRCVGSHQHDIKTAHCDASDIQPWCAEAVANQAARRGQGAGSGDAMYRVANLLSTEGATAAAYDPVRQQLFQGSACQKRSSYDDECSAAMTNITQWDVQNQTQLATLHAHNATITALAYDAARQILFSTSNEAAPGECCGVVLVWNTSISPPTQVTSLTSSQTLESCNPRVSGAPQIGIRALEFDPARHLLFASCGNSVMSWDVTSVAAPVQKPSATFGGDFEKNAAITAMAYDSTHQVLYTNLQTGDPDGYNEKNLKPSRTIHRWSTASVIAGEYDTVRLPDMAGHLGGVNALAFDAAGSRLFSASQLGEIIYWNIFGGTQGHQQRAKSALIWYLPSGDIGDPTELSMQNSKGSPAVQYLSYDADNLTLYAGSTRGLVTLWDVSTAPPQLTNSVGCAVESGKSSSDLRVQAMLVDTVHRQLFCSSACTGSYDSDCPVSGVTEIWQIPRGGRNERW